MQAIPPFPARSGKARPWHTFRNDYPSESNKSVTHPSTMTIDHHTQSSLECGLAEESIRTELCNGSDPNGRRSCTPERDLSVPTSDPAELTFRLLRENSAAWVSNHHPVHEKNDLGFPPSRNPRATAAATSFLVAGIAPEKEPRDEQRDMDVMDMGLDIERPRSALHSGNFTPDEGSFDDHPSHAEVAREDGMQNQQTGQLWMLTSPRRDFRFPGYEGGLVSYRRDAVRPSASIASSLSFSFVHQTPTSPLVQSASNDDVDCDSPPNVVNITANDAYFLSTSASTTHANLSRRRSYGTGLESSRPYQAHQPRLSLTLTPNTMLGGSSPQSWACLRSRPKSYSSDLSPLQHASMVGSYEESILRGRMSTTPSKPLEFVAQIGVLGLGKCTPSLRCPRHVTVPFSAVFYSYATTGHERSKMEDGPSPYVGQIDVENGLPSSAQEQWAKRKRHSRYAARKGTDDAESTHKNSAVPAKRFAPPSTTRKRTRSPKAPPGGQYRIPEKGQLQMMIKNQNKTAVKLFLVPYDLTGMEGGTKTFIRQRSYCEAPMMDSILPAKNGEAADRPTLRYLIHLHICCPSKGQFYLYKSIRVVFANRVPDGKEKLRNEVTCPEPRFSPYKPVRVMHPPLSADSNHAAKQAFPRRSSGFSFASPVPTDSGFSCLTTSATPVDAICLRRSVKSFPSETSDTTERMRWPDSSRANRSTTQTLSMDTSLGLYDKLNKGEVGYGGNAFVSSAYRILGVSERLLSQRRLQSLGMRPLQVLGAESETAQD